MERDVFLGNGRLISGRGPAAAGNSPMEYQGRKRRYFEWETVSFTQQYARYAANFVEAEAQLNPENPDEWRRVNVRLADAIAMPSTGEKRTGDYQKILVEDASIDYIPPGSKWRILGSVWLAVNPDNLSGPGATALLCRCNAAWRHLDDYGNVLSEPMFLQNPAARASSPDAQMLMKITKGYFMAVCQRNRWTQQLNTNSRILLGKGAYAVRGYTDFLQEFTGQDASARLVQFTLEYTEPDPAIDDLEAGVAGGKADFWEIRIFGSGQLAAGETAQFSAKAYRNGQELGGEIPVGFSWETADPAVAQTGPDGQITGVGEGETILTVRLEQNPSLFAQMLLQVGSAQGSAVFLETGPDTLEAYETAILRAAWFENGRDSGEAGQWQFSGADRACYTASVQGNQAEITCWSGSVEPLRVEAVFAGGKTVREIMLRGM